MRENRRKRSSSVIRRPPSGLLLVLLLMSFPISARDFMSQQQALASAFPRGASTERQSVFLTKAEMARASELSGGGIESALAIRYIARMEGRVIGYAYFDAHRVRTLPETIMIVVKPDSSIDRIDILSFSEPMDYFPRERWIDQFDGKKLDEELSLKRAIRPISGATLTGRAITNAARKILAIHAVIEGRTTQKGEIRGRK